MAGFGSVVMPLLLLLLPLLLMLDQSSVCQGLQLCALRPTFDEAVEECALLLSICPAKLVTLRVGNLPSDAETKRLIRCVGVRCRFWSDYTGLRQDLVARYFVADRNDTLCINRTTACLESVAKRSVDPFDRENCCDLAYRSFLCYYHNYGNLRRTRQFIPLDRMQLVHVTAQCMDMLQISVEDLADLTVDEMDDSDRLHCLVRCIGIRTELYSDKMGVNVDLMYAQYGEGYTEKNYKANAYRCAKQYSKGKSSDNLCRRAYHLLYKCFEHVRNPITQYELEDEV
ncbi:general odorant-binding protein 45-like [Anopheles darlingi]|uniref:general odorant-binding protein 45-like n=1 Tax=Anopheles darlingi TaxID=43151 RepID=UPI0020FFFECF|nr:general odorant-binding protein 45-like [Anopheles darlingi]